MSWKEAHLDGGWICTLCNWRQTQGTPDILASRVHWCNNCRKKRPSLWSQTSGPPFLQAEFLSSICPGSSAGDLQVVDLRCLQYLPDGSVSYKINTLTSGDTYHKGGEGIKLMTTQSPRCMRHPCASRAESGSIFSSWRKKEAQRLPSLLWCTASRRLDTEHRKFVSSDSKAGIPGHQRNMLSSLRIRTFMVISYN